MYAGIYTSREQQSNPKNSHTMTINYKKKKSHTYLVGIGVHSGAIFLKVADRVVAQHVQMCRTPLTKKRGE